ncbi:hypothetical protein ACI2KR_30500 [Pseudomonas luteola]
MQTLVATPSEETLLSLLETQYGEKAQLSNEDKITFLTILREEGHSQKSAHSDADQSYSIHHKLKQCSSPALLLLADHYRDVYWKYAAYDFSLALGS